MPQYTVIMKLTCFTCIVAAAMLASCTQNNTQTTSASKDSVNVTSAAVIKDAKANAVFLGYLQLKNALVNSSTDSARTASITLAQALKNIDGCETTAKIADSISNTTDLKVQRKHFVTLSADIIPLIKHTELQKGTVYIQHCPMANDGKGAYWLASESAVKNPYYGSEMLECGSVEEEIKSK